MGHQGAGRRDRFTSWPSPCLSGGLSGGLSGQAGQGHDGLPAHRDSDSPAAPHIVMPTEVGIHAFACTNTGVDGGPPPAMTVEGSASDGEADAFDPLLANAEATAREAIAEDMQPDAFAARLQGLPGRHFVTLPQQSARWWTHGGPNVAPQSLTLAGLPAMPQFAGLLAGERG